MTERANTIARRINKVIYREGDTVVKLFDNGFSKADILNEALNQARMEETNLKIPQVLEVEKIDGQWAIRLEYIPGKTLSALMEENPQKQDEYLNLLVELQMSVHACLSPLLTHLSDKMRRKIDQSGLNATTRYDLQTRLGSMPRHYKVCHGDFRPSNVIITPDGVPYLLDWSHVTQGNASADVARTYLVFCLEGREALGKQYLKLFSEKSDTALQYVQKWIPIVAASQLVKGNEAERNLLLSWVDVVDYQ